MFYFSLYLLLTDSWWYISVRRKPCTKMANKNLMEKLSDMRKDFVADRVRDKQDQAYVEERGRALLSFRRSENGVIMSGDKVRLRKIMEAASVVDIAWLCSYLIRTDRLKQFPFPSFPFSCPCIQGTSLYVKRAPQPVPFPFCLSSPFRPPRSLLFIAIFRWSLVSNFSPTVESIAAESIPHFLFPGRFHFSAVLWSDDKKQLFCVLFRAYICLKRCTKFYFLQYFGLFQNFNFFDFVLKFAGQQAFKHFCILCLHCLAALRRLNQNRFLA